MFYMKFAKSLQLYTENKNQKMSRFPEHNATKSVNGISMLSILSKYDFTAFSIPHPSDDVHPLYIIQAKQGSQKNISLEKIIEIRLKSLIRQCAEGFEHKKIGDTAIWSSIHNQIKLYNKEKELSGNSGERKIELLSSKLTKLYGSIDPNKIIGVCKTSQDCTPWNVSAHENRLYKFEWELMDRSIPVFIDFFHFHFQSAISVFHESFKKTNERIKHSLNAPFVKDAIEKFDVNVEVHYKLYLLFTISYYLRIYTNQKFSSVQINQLMNAWNEALFEIK